VIRCLNFRVCAQNTLRGFADLELTHNGIVLRDCPFHEKNGNMWVAFPARPYQGADGVKRWQPVIEFAPGAKREEFQRLAIEAINTYTKQNAGSAS
jgi:hypothetical protein